MKLCGQIPEARDPQKLTEVLTKWTECCKESKIVSTGNHPRSNIIELSTEGKLDALAEVPHGKF
jgi:hypothetical protein